MAILVLDRMWVNKLDTGEAVSGFSRDRNITHTMDGEVRTYAGGRQRSIAIVGTQDVFDFVLRYISMTDLARLRTWLGLTVQIRDNHGQIFIGTFFNLSASEPFKRPNYDVQLSVLVVTV